jgi:AraC-like DNA-binding protein
MHHPAPGGDDCLALAVDDGTWERAMGVRPARERAVTLSPETQLAGLGLLSALTAGRLSGLERDAASLHLLGLLSRDAGTPGDAARRRSREPARRTVARATAFLAAHVDRAVTLAELGAAAHCSPYHLTTLFRRITGLPLHRYHLRWRLLLALERIGRGERRLLDVALEFGFASASHFSNAVRATFGAPPSRLAVRLASGGRQARKIPQA